MCQVGVCNEGRCPSMAIGLSEECKSMFHQSFTMPWCHTLVHFEVKMNRFRAGIQENRTNRGGTSATQAAFLPRQFPMRYARLGPSSVPV